MVGDSIDDMTAGRKAGAATVLLANEINEELREHENTDLIVTKWVPSFHYFILWLMRRSIARWYWSEWPMVDYRIWYRYWKMALYRERYCKEGITARAKKHDLIIRIWFSGISPVRLYAKKRGGGGWYIDNSFRTKALKLSSEDEGSSWTSLE